MPKKNLTYTPPELQSHLIPDKDLPLPEYCFIVETDYDEAPKLNRAVDKLKKIITALLNTSGGIIIIESLYAEPLGERVKAKWLMQFTEQLSKFIPPSVLQTCIQIIPKESRIFVEILKSPEMITVAYHLNIRLQAANYSLTEAKCVHKVLTRNSNAPAADPFSAPTVIYDSTLNVMESESVEYKYWDVKKFSILKSKLKEERTIKSFFAFANMPSGGFVTIGVKEEEKSGKCVIYGQVLNEDQESQLRTLLSGILGKATLVRNSSTENEPPTQYIDWGLTFVPVLGCPDDERRRLIVLQIKHCPGGVFVQPPESYQLAEDGSVLELPFQHWLQLFENSKTQYERHFPLGYQLGEHHRNIGSEKREEPATSSFESPGHYTNEPPIDDQCQALKPSDESVNAALKQIKSLSWTRHTKKWNSYLVQISLASHQNILDFTSKSHILRATRPVRFTPGISTIINSCQHPSEMNEALTYIQLSLGLNCQGFAIASSKWLANLPSSISVQAPEYHALDVFLVDEEANIHLWSLMDPNTPVGEEAAMWTYCLLSARLTKRTLSCLPTPVPFDGVSEPRISIHCHVYKLGAGELAMKAQHVDTEITDLFQKYTLSYADVQIRVATALLNKKTYIKEHLGREQEIFMTCQQMEHLLNSDLNRFNYIEGPPGCGKTYLALRIADNYPKNSVGYICTTVPYEAFLVYQNCCIPILLQTETELMEAVHSGRLDKYTCLIIDDIHNITCSELSWLQLFERVKSHPNIHLFLFADSRYQNFKCPRNMVMLKKCMHEFCERNNIPCHEKPLTVIHRNNRKIVSFLRCCIYDDEDNHRKQLACSSEEDGDDVEIYYIRDVLVDSSDNPLLVMTKELMAEEKVMRGDQCSYEGKDIVILVDTEVAHHHVEQLTKVFKLYWKSLTIQHAGVFPVTGLTMDTLDNFMGFDRRVCICVTSSDFTECRKDNSGRTMLNPKYKAFVASRGISRVIFVVQKPLTVTLARNLKLDKLPSKPICSINNETEEKDEVAYAPSDIAHLGTPKMTMCIWHLEQSEEICDLCFMRTPHGLGVLYITAIFKTQLVSLEGEPLELDINVESIRNPVRTASCLGVQSDLVLTDRNAPYSWTVFSRQSDGRYGQRKNGINGKIESVCWTPNGELIMVVQKSDDYRLMRYTVGGWLVWDMGKDKTQLGDPRRLSVGTDGHIYVPDLGSECVRVFNSHGHHERVIQPTSGPIHYPRAVCVDSTDQWLFISHGVMSGRDLISVISTRGGEMRRVIETSGRVWALDLHEDRYLAVGTTWGLLLYDVSGEFWA